MYVHREITRLAASMALLSFAAHVIAAPTSAPSPPGSAGCGNALPDQLQPGGPSFYFADFASNSSPDNPLRAYSLTIPIHYDPNVPSPLIFSFHGSGQDSKIQEVTTGFSDPVANPEAIVVYPQAINKLWIGDPTMPTNINDTLFVSELLDFLENQYCVMTSRVYVTGFSNGGGLTNHLLRNFGLSSRIAAAGVASGALYQGFQGPYESSRTDIPIIEMHGGSDMRAPYNGGVNQVRPGGYVNVAIPSWLEEWAARENCDPNKNVIRLPAETTNGFDVKRLDWTCAGQPGLISHMYSQQQVHAWPTLTSAGYDGSRVMLDFLAQYVLPDQASEPGNPGMTSVER